MSKKHVKIYQLAPLWVVIKGVLASLEMVISAAALLLIILRITTRFDYVPLLFASFFIFLLMYGLITIYGIVVGKPRLVVSSQGIEYHQPGYSIFANWKDASHIETGWRVMSIDGWPISSLAVRQSRLEERGLAWFIRLIRRDRYIPLALFAFNWMTSDLVLDLQQYAPQALGLKVKSGSA